MVGPGIVYIKISYLTDNSPRKDIKNIGDK
jgi:hypothetical protein